MQFINFVFLKHPHIWSDCLIFVCFPPIQLITGTVLMRPDSFSFTVNLLMSHQCMVISIHKK
jgi:hypothetical protein